MIETKPTPPFAPTLPPPPPLIVLLNDTDLVLDPLPDILLGEDLPLASPRVRFHPYKRPPPSPLRPGFTRKSPSIQRPTSPTPSIDTDDLSDESSDLSSIESTPWGTPVPPAASTSRISKKIRFKRPKGAGRKSLAELVSWDADLMASIKVNQPYPQQLNADNLHEG